MGAVAGLLSGILGVGGGIIMVPAMVFLLGMSQHIAEGTSLMAILFTADAGTRVNLKNQRVDLRQTAMIGLGGILFALVGVQLALALSSEVLTLLFGVFVAVVGIRMIVRLVSDRTKASMAT